jgi:hypothetical protein
MHAALGLVLAFSGGGYGVHAYHDQTVYRRCEPVVRRVVYTRPAYDCRPAYRTVRSDRCWDTVPRARCHDRTYDSRACDYRPVRYASYSRGCR